MELEESWNKVEAELENAIANLKTVVQLLPTLPVSVRRSGSVGGAAIAVHERLIQLARDVRRAREPRLGGTGGTMP